MKKKTLALVLALVLGTAMTAGCGGDSSASTASTTETSDASEDTAKEETKEAEPEEEAEEEEAEEAEVEETADEAAEEKAEKIEGSEVFEQLKEILTVGYAGADESKAALYWAMDDDCTMGMFIDVPTDGSEPLVIAGDITVNDDGSFTLTDDQDGTSLNLEIEVTTDDDGEKCYLLTAENGASGLMYEVSSEDVLDVMSSIADGTYENPLE